MMKWFICPDEGKIEPCECLKEGGCRMGDRCASRSTLKLASRQREWKGTPSTTQMINGTMLAFLQLTVDYGLSIDQMAFRLLGTSSHAKLEVEDELSLLEQKFEQDGQSGIADFVETENGLSILGDYKTSGSFKVSKALGFYKKTIFTGEYYKSGERKDEPKTKKILVQEPDKVDMREWELQLNRYRLFVESNDIKINRIKIEAIVRDGGTIAARSRGVDKNLYYFDVKILPDEEVREYFKQKRDALLKALADGKWDEPCKEEERWGNGDKKPLRCLFYCPVNFACPFYKELVVDKEDDVEQEKIVKVA
ncbi:hypothetical protein KKC91_11135 [bacterium]|nr:hypothetical protein [bacterium]